MAREIVRERQVIPEDTTERTVVTEQHPATGADIVRRVVTAVFAIIISLLTLRFILALLGANTANGVVNALYDLTNPFVSPFTNFFNTADSIQTANGSRFELETLVAIIFFVLLGWIISVIISIFNREETV